MEKHCENCKYAEQTDIDGLIDCKKDGHSKDCDMVCEQFAKQDKGNVLDWLNERNNAASRNKKFGRRRC